MKRAKNLQKVENSSKSDKLAEITSNTEKNSDFRTAGNNLPKPLSPQKLAQKTEKIERILPDFKDQIQKPETRENPIPENTEISERELAEISAISEKYEKKIKKFESKLTANSGKASFWPPESDFQQLMKKRIERTRAKLAEKVGEIREKFGEMKKEAAGAITNEIELKRK